MSQVVVIRMLKPDEHGVSRARQCYFVRDAQGPVKYKECELQADKKGKKIPFRMPGTAGYVACQPKRASLDPMRRDGEQHVCIRTDDPRVVTCPDCIATSEYKEAMKQFDNLEVVGVG